MILGANFPGIGFPRYKLKGLMNVFWYIPIPIFALSYSQLVHPICQHCSACLRSFLLLIIVRCTAVISVCRDPPVQLCAASLQYSICRCRSWLSPQCAAAEPDFALLVTPRLCSLNHPLPGLQGTAALCSVPST